MPSYKCPAVIKAEVMHVSHENASCVPMKKKVVFHVSKPMEGENVYNQKLFFNTVVHFDT